MSKFSIFLGRGTQISIANTKLRESVVRAAEERNVGEEKLKAQLDKLCSPEDRAECQSVLEGGGSVTTSLYDLNDLTPEVRKKAVAFLRQLAKQAGSKVREVRFTVTAPKSGKVVGKSSGLKGILNAPVTIMGAELERAGASKSDGPSAFDSAIASILGSEDTDSETADA